MTETAFVGTLGRGGRRYVWVIEGGNVAPLDSFGPQLRPLVPGYSWGDNSIGSGQLAAALLYWITRDPEVALRLSDRFHRSVIITLKRDGWVLTHALILRWIMQVISETSLPGTIELGGAGEVLA